MKILVTGANGQLGFDVIAEAAKRGHNAVGVDIGEMDITDKEATENTIKSIMPDAVIHCAAWTAVDMAESNEEKCRNVNLNGTKNIAYACRNIRSKMLYVSTDYVFDGSGEKPWEVTDIPAPVSAYGKTKFEGEKAVRELLDNYFIVRTAWVFGQNGNNFVKTMLKLGKEKDGVSVVSDQYGSPTYTADLAKLLVDMIESEKYGIYHATNEGFCSWYEFAKEIFALAGYKTKVVPIVSSSYPTQAKRPQNSRLSKKELTVKEFIRLPDWKDALKRFLQSIDL